MTGSIPSAAIRAARSGRAHRAEDTLALLVQACPQALAQVAAADDEGGHDSTSSGSASGAAAASISGQPASR